MSDREHDALLNQLAALREEVPPVPETFHQGWTRLVEEETMKPETSADRKTSRRPAVLRTLAAAAALLFLIGGTLLTRDELNPGSRSASQARSAAKVYGTASYEASPANGMMMEASMADTYEEPLEETMETAMDKGTGAEEAAAGADARETKLIRSASLSITTRDFDGAMVGIRALCEQSGGWVAYSDVYSGSSYRSGSLSLRIPADGLDSFLTGTEGFGRITARSENTQDVTESYYDTKGRLETQQALMARLRELTGKAGDLSDLLELESQMAETQYTIDSLQRSLNRTDRQVSYSTVDISLREETDTDTVQNPELSLGERMLTGLRAGLASLGAFLSDMAVFLAAALPFLLIIVLAVIIIAVIRRRKIRGKGKEEYLAQQDASDQTSGS